MLKKITIAGLTAASFTSATAQVMPYADTIIVLDTSNSMWGQIDGISKISIAKAVIGDLVTDLEEDIDFGLMAYGHRVTSDCGDIELIVPVSDLNTDTFKQAVNGLTPRGRTPLTAAVAEAAEALDYQTRSARIVLVSDGVESCDGDPVALAETLAANGLDFTLHVIGFDVSDIEDQSGLEALAVQNHGLYLTPDNSAELKEDLNSMMEMEPEVTADAGVEETPAMLSAAETVSPRGRIKVDFTGPMGADDYIGLAEVGEASETVLAIARVSSNGSALLIAPRTPGNYELRYYTGNGDVLAMQEIAVQ